MLWLLEIAKLAAVNELDRCRNRDRSRAVSIMVNLRVCLLKPLPNRLDRPIATLTISARQYLHRRARIDELIPVD